MDKIKIMDIHLANMIAAGEVIERPSSVVKELVENSIDAQSKNIEVRIYEAGRKKIIVTDDGSGMSRNDALKAFERHASSKIYDERDLFRIKTMGFRGEALPSISSVSKVVLTTSDGVEGTKISLTQDSKVVSDAPLRKGTTFEVEELFYNTPARLKFLKTDYTENASIIEVMQRLSLSRPDIAFSLYIDDRKSFITSGRGNLLEVIGQIYGYDTSRKMLDVHFENYEYEIDGYIGTPEIAKSNRYFMITILNERSVYIPKLQRAIQEAYNDFIFNSKFPFVILKIKIEPQLVDVNVHPAKREVRLSNEDKICDTVFNLIKERLEQTKPITQSLLDKQHNDEIKIAPKDLEKIDLLLDIEEEKKEERKEELNIFRPVNRPINQIKVEFNEEEFDEEIQTPFASEAKFKAPKLEPIAITLKKYIICEGEDGIYLVDQHAAHERVNYEKFKKLYNTHIQVIDLLVPLIINLTLAELQRLNEDKLKILEDIGIIATPFGGNSLKVSQIPSYFKEANEEAYCEDVISQVLEKDRIDTYLLRKKVLSTMACKASIRAGDTISLVEAKDVINQLFKCENPTCCPHGRPTIVHFSEYDLDKMFKRSGI